MFSRNPQLVRISVISSKKSFYLNIIVILPYIAADVSLHPFPLKSTLFLFYCSKNRPDSIGIRPVLYRIKLCLLDAFSKFYCLFYIIVIGSALVDSLEFTLAVEFLVEHGNSYLVSLSLNLLVG